MDGSLLRGIAVQHHKETSCRRGWSIPAQSDSLRLFVPPCFIIDRRRSIIDADDRRGMWKAKARRRIYLLLHVVKDDSAPLQLRRCFHGHGMWWKPTRWPALVTNSSITEITNRFQSTVARDPHTLSGLLSMIWNQNTATVCELESHSGLFSSHPPLSETCSLYSSCTFIRFLC